jgi:tetratricopeptide (TPR) repeat protein
MLGWFGDLGRLSWGFVYWNVRKSRFRIRGAYGPAPCQHPSDSGKAGKTGCDACSGWRDKDRFRILCPLLVKAQNGQRVCSVDAADVRPFWGRAVLSYLGFGAAVSLVAILGVFTAFRAIGYRVPLVAVAWPPAWHRIQKARADYFYLMAKRTLAEGDVRKSYLALNQVYALDPDNRDAAQLLAEFAQLGNPDYSDEIYERLLQAHSGGSEETAQAWFRALLLRGDMPSVAGLSAKMLRERSAEVPAWTHGLVFAEGLTGDPSEVDRVLAGTTPISDEARSVLAVAKSLRTGSAGDRAKMAELYLGGATTAFERQYSLSRLVALGGARTALAFLDAHGNDALGIYDREALKLDAYSALGWDALTRSEIDTLFQQGVSPALVTLVSSHLVRHPDAGAAARVFELLDSSPLRDSPDGLSAHTVLLCMAGVNGLDARMKEQAEAVGALTGGKFPAWQRVRDFFENPAPTKNPSVFLPMLPQLPTEFVYALIGHYREAAVSPVP